MSALRTTSSDTLARRPSHSQFDYGSAYIDILARDLLTDHEVCTGFKPHSL